MVLWLHQLARPRLLVVYLHHLQFRDHRPYPFLCLFLDRLLLRLWRCPQPQLGRCLTLFYVSMFPPERIYQTLRLYTSDKVHPELKVSL